MSRWLRWSIVLRVSHENVCFCWLEELPFGLKPVFLEFLRIFSRKIILCKISGFNPHKIRFNPSKFRFNQTLETFEKLKIPVWMEGTFCSCLVFGGGGVRQVRWGGVRSGQIWSGGVELSEVRWGWVRLGLPIISFEFEFWDWVLNFSFEPFLVMAA